MIIGPTIIKKRIPVGNLSLMEGPGYSLIFIKLFEKISDFRTSRAKVHSNQVTGLKTR